MKTLTKVFLQLTMFILINRVNGQAYIITTVAGIDSVGGYSGDGGPATAAEFTFPLGVSVDSLGNYYIADAGNSRIRKISTAGIITTFAGNGNPGYAGNGGPATNAELSSPYWAVADDSGNVYIVDGDNRIRKVNKSGIISTFAGNGSSGFAGDGGLATAAEINGTVNMAIDKAGNVYLADGGNNRVRKIDKGDTISTIAGNGSAGYSGDGGPATAAALNGLDAVIVDDSGNVYISDANNNLIRKININGIIYTIAGKLTAGYSGDGGPATAAELNGPSDIRVDNHGNIFIADENNQVVRKIDKNGIISTIAGNGIQGYSGDGGPATAAEFVFPYSIAPDKQGNIYVSDQGNVCIRLLTISTSVNEISNTHNINVYPNPGNGVYTFYGMNRKVKIEIYNMLGQKVYANEATSSFQKVDLQGNQQGIYLYRVLNTADELLESGKLILE